MKTRVGIAIAVAVLGFAAPASADTIANFTLDGVTFSGGGTATGTFALDLDTSTLSNVNITTSADDLGDFGETYTLGSFSNGPASFDFVDGFPPFVGDELIINLAATLTPSNLASSTSFTIQNGNEAFYFFPLCGFAACDSRDIDAGSLDEVLTTTPLPPTLPLFAGGLGMVGFLSRRRKRKADALAAA